MYRAFNLSQCDWNGVDPRDGVSLHETNSIVVRKTLENFLNPETGKIDGGEMREHWFPQIKADVFISHSSADKDDALTLASLLKHSFKLNSFIDSSVWGQADDLLRQIDNKFCLNDDKQTYNYEIRNRSTSHVHMMLSTALGMMIDTAECVIFMNTPNSVTTSQATSKTGSPWIFHELSQMSLIRRRRLADYRPKLLEENFSNVKRGAYASLPIEHIVSMGALTEINAGVLRGWQQAWKDADTANEYALDLLYKIAPKEN
jgi:hypothetical protein